MLNAEKIFRIPFLDPIDLRPGQETLLGKDQLCLNGFFEPVQSPGSGQTTYHFIKRPGFSTFSTPSGTGPGRGVFNWKVTNKLYSVNGNKIFSNTTDLGVTLSTTSGIVNFEETRPGATVQYLGINDGQALYLVANDDSVLVLNNVPIVSSSVANPTHIVTGSPHGLNTGNKVIIRGHAGSTPSINDTIRTITKIDATTFTIPVNVTVAGTGGTIGVFPAPNTTDLHYMDTYWFTMKPDGSIWNCAIDDPTTWPITGFISTLMLPGRGVGLAKQNNVLIAFSDRHFQTFVDASNPVGSPLGNVEQGMQRVGSISSPSIAYQENATFWVSSTLTGGFTVYQLEGTASLNDIGTPALERSLISNFFQTPGAPTPTQIVLTSGTSWTVPGDFNVNNNTIEAIGAGGGGGGQHPVTFGLHTLFGGQGGGGGAYAKLVNFNPGAGPVAYTIGQGGLGGIATTGVATDGTDTTFSVTSLVAKGGHKGNDGTPNGATAAASTGVVTYSGGNGGNLGGGGGGGAGKLGDGDAGSDGATTSNTGPGGTGGTGDSPIGGAGGITDMPGNNGTEWTTAGSGGGGGGGTSKAYPANPGQAGGLYGAGGGGAGTSPDGGTTLAVGGAGAQGVIVITYTPAGASVLDAANGYILRIAGHIYYVLNLITNNETWVYDVKLKLWTKWMSGLTYWPVVNVVQFAQTGQPSLLIGQDPIAGKLWTISQSIGQDNGSNYEVRVQTNPLTLGNMERKFYNRVELFGDRQTTATPVSISYSDDDFFTTSPARTFDMSSTRTFGRSWGNSRRRAWQLSYIGPNPLRISALELAYNMPGNHE